MERFDVEVRYVIENPASRECMEYAGSFVCRAAAEDALANWSRFSGVRHLAIIRPRILPTIVVERRRHDTPIYGGDLMRFVGGTY